MPFELGRPHRLSHRNPYERREHWLQCPQCGNLGRVRFYGVPLTEAPAKGKQIIFHGSTRLAVDWYINCVTCDQDVPISPPTFQ